MQYVVLTSEKIHVVIAKFQNGWGKGIEGGIAWIEAEAGVGEKLWRNQSAMGKVAASVVSKGKIAEVAIILLLERLANFQKNDSVSDWQIQLNRVQ